MTDIGDYEQGGDWTAEWRRLHIDTSGWIRGGDIPTRMHAVRSAALAADRDDEHYQLQALQKALRKLDLEITLFEQRLSRVRSMVGDFEAVVLRARDKWTPSEPVDNGIPVEDDMLERLSDLYGFPRPRHNGRDK